MIFSPAEIIIALIILLIAFIIDGRIRRKSYVTDVNLARIQAKKEFNTKSQVFENVMNQNWQDMINMNNFRYGIIGQFEYDIKPNDEYSGSGEQLSVGTGIVLDRKFITRGDIVDDMAAFVQKSKKPFVADPKELRDRHIVVMYLQNNMIPRGRVEYIDVSLTYGGSDVPYSWIYWFPPFLDNWYFVGWATYWYQYPNEIYLSDQIITVGIDKNE